MPLIALGASLAVMVYLALATRGMMGDQGCYAEWMRQVLTYGVRGAYGSHQPSCLVTYPPVYLFVLDAYARVLVLFGHASFSNDPGTIYGKLLPVLLLFGALSWVAWYAMRGRLHDWRSCPWPLLLLLFNPALLIDGPVWGQTDALFAVLGVASLLSAANQPLLSGALYGIAVLTKPQAGAIAPALGAMLIFMPVGRLGSVEWMKVAARRVGAFLAGVAAAVVPTFGFFAIAGRLYDMLHLSLFFAVGAYPFASMHAFNLWWWLLGVNPMTHDTIHILTGITLRNFSLVLLLLACIAVVVWVARSLRGATGQRVAEIAVEAGALCYFAMFMLSTEMHERYEYPVVFGLAALAMIGGGKRFGVLVMVTITSFFNILFVMTGATLPAETMWIVYLNIVAGCLWVKEMVADLCRHERTILDRGVGG